MRSILLLLGLAASSSLGQTVSLPPLTGPLKVGTIALELNDKSRSRDLMVSVFYPTVPPSNAHIGPVYTPAYAAYIAESQSIPVELALSLYSQSYAATPLDFCAKPGSGSGSHESYREKRHSSQPPIVLFSPGYGSQRVDYTSVVENLASHGFIAISIDHPNDTVFIDYPDGRTVLTPPIDLDLTSAAYKTDVRAADLSFVLDALSRDAKLARKIPGVKAALDVRRVGVFGHSLGGAASATVMLKDRRFACGANLDGTFWGDVVKKGVAGAFMIVGAEGRNRTEDSSWGDFWKNSKGRLWGREISVTGSRHGSFTDLPYLFEILVALGVVKEFPVAVFGTIKGERIVELESAYVTAFFQRCFDRKHGKPRTPKLLQGPSKAFPEVVFWPQ